MTEIEKIEKPKIVRMEQIYTVGGNYDDPSEFTNMVNRNLKILYENDKHTKILDIKFTVSNDPRFIEHGMLYLAFIVAEVDVDLTPKVEEDGITRKKKKKR